MTQEISLGFSRSQGGQSQQVRNRIQFGADIAAWILFPVLYLILNPYLGEIVGIISVIPVIWIWHLLRTLRPGLDDRTGLPPPRRAR